MIFYIYCIKKEIKPLIFHFLGDDVELYDKIADI